MDRIDVEPLFDSEYFVDLLSFSTPAVWDDIWSASTAPAYRVNSASLDCCDLMLQQEFRFRKQLPHGLAFKFRLFQNEEKERQDFFYQMELEKKLGRGVSVSLFGEPTYRKEDSDIGFGLAYEPVPAFKASARRTFVDFNFNQRGSTTQRYAAKPATDELALELTPGDGWKATAALMLDHPLRREIPDDARTFSYRRTNLALGLRQDLADRWSRWLSYSYDFEAKGDLYNPASASKTSVTSRRQVHRVAAAVEGALSPRDRLEAGQGFLLRAARSDYANAPDEGLFYRRWEAQPYARWRRELKPWLVSELAGFLAFGEKRQRGANKGGTLYNGLAEAKLGAGADFVFGPSGRIGVYGTFDLDTPGKPWDGGAIRAMFLF